LAHEEIKVQCQAQKELLEEAGKTVKREYCHETNDEQLREAVHNYCYDKCYEIAKNPSTKKERTAAFDALKQEFIETIPEEEREEKAGMVERYYHDVEKKAMRNLVLN